MYDISISINGGLRVDLQTKTVEEALSSFKPGTIKDKVLIEVKNNKNGKQTERQLFVPRARFTFNHPMAITILARNIERTLL